MRPRSEPTHGALQQLSLRRARRNRPSGLRVRLLARHARRRRSGLGSDGAALPAGGALGLLLGTGVRRHAGGARNRASRGSLRHEHRGHPGRPARLHGRRGRPRLANRETDRGRTGGTDRRCVLLGLAPLSRVEVRSGARLLRLRPRLRLSHPPARPPTCREAKPARRGTPRPRARARVVADPAGAPHRAPRARVAPLEAEGDLARRLDRAAGRRARRAPLAALQHRARLVVVRRGLRSDAVPDASPGVLLRDVPDGTRPPGSVHVRVAPREGAVRRRVCGL